MCFRSLSPRLDALDSKDLSVAVIGRTGTSFAKHQYPHDSVTRQDWPVNISSSLVQLQDLNAIQQHRTTPSFVARCVPNMSAPGKGDTTLWDGSANALDLIVLSSLPYMDGVRSFDLLSRWQGRRASSCLCFLHQNERPGTKAKSAIVLKTQKCL